MEAVRRRGSGVAREFLLRRQGGVTDEHAILALGFNQPSEVVNDRVLPLEHRVDLIAC